MVVVPLGFVHTSVALASVSRAETFIVALVLVCEALTEGVGVTNETVGSGELNERVALEPVALSSLSTAVT